jgi:hypothetical protein
MNEWHEQQNTCEKHEDRPTKEEMNGKTLSAKHWVKLPASRAGFMEDVPAKKRSPLIVEARER